MCTLLSVVLRPLGEDQTILARNLRIHAASVGRRSTIGWFIYKRTPSRARIRPENTLQYRTDPPRDEFVVAQALGAGLLAGSHPQQRIEDLAGKSLGLLASLRVSAYAVFCL